jgi:hypothetical protein
MRSCARFVALIFAAICSGVNCTFPLSCFYRWPRIMARPPSLSYLSSVYLAVSPPRCCHQLAPYVHTVIPPLPWASWPSFALLVRSFVSSDVFAVFASYVLLHITPPVTG